MLAPIKSNINPLSPKEKLLNALAAAFTILALGFVLKILPHKHLMLPLLASMGASAFLIFIVPHSPMSQPWPLIGGHLISAIIAVAIGHLTNNILVAGALSVGTSILAMQLLSCLHPPGAATALATLEGTQLHDMGLQYVAYAVIGNTFLLFIIAFMINNLALGRRYPARSNSSLHHPGSRKIHAKNAPKLEINDNDIEWALRQMNSIVDASKEDLIDVYDLAMEHAMMRMHADNKDKTGTA